MNAVHVVLPGGVDDPAAPSGGNVYDRRVCDGLAASGWTVHEHPVPGAWPYPTATDLDRLAGVLATLPDGAVVLLDGLVAVAAPDVLAACTPRLRPVVLAHMLFGDADPDLRPGEARVLRGAAAVVTTSHWCRRRAIEAYALPPAHVHAAPPGVDPAPPAPATAAGTRLLCVAALAPHKGHDLLLDALDTLTGLPWSCVLVGSPERDPAYAARLRAHPVADRITFAGVRTGGGLDAAYDAADLLVLPSHGESYGMVVTEALARGIPVLATDVQGLPEALGAAPDGTVPGLLVPPDSAALADALRRWLTDPGLRERLRQAAQARRGGLTGWAHTADQVGAALSPLAR
ncbi:glycosyltransferase family 4 protein [Catellatospora methionotrophica]|uniref:glycosyltransferase family 4 protein n=1 Tax=Catellatospora methionotrophica TaxID=121620 RepID=UPI001EF2E20B|nr:glycosyltransferase family 4 protein [Catellatospora methionotrophica]